jgi:hypothetical protein
MSRFDLSSGGTFDEKRSTRKEKAELHNQTDVFGDSNHFSQTEVCKWTSHRRIVSITVGLALICGLIEVHGFGGW